MNSFVNGLVDATNFTRTANGAVAHKTTCSKVYDMFAFGGAYRRRSDEDCILLFKNAYEEDPVLALKCLFYLRDCRGGQGERRFFRLCFKWLCLNDPKAAIRNLDNLSEYGRWDDLWMATYGTPVFLHAQEKIKSQLMMDMSCKTPSLLAKWLPSENASSKETKKMAGEIREHLKITHKEYRKMLSKLRTNINIVEKLMSENRWDEIQFDKIPSKAGLVYRNAFARRDIIAKKYEKFVKNENTKVNAKTLYPYEIVAQATKGCSSWDYDFSHISEVERLALQKAWENQKDYFGGVKKNILGMIDTSGSMTCGSGVNKPIHYAIGLGLYAANYNSGPFKDVFMTFSSEPQLLKFEGVDFVDKVQRVYKQNLCENTDLVKAMRLLLKVAMHSNPEDVPDTLVVISDMQIDAGCMNYSRGRGYGLYGSQHDMTEMEAVRKEWEAAGLEMPHIVYWNVNASQNTILDNSYGVTCVSGASPVLFEQILSGVTGYDLMLKKLMSERYAAVK